MRSGTSKISITITLVFLILVGLAQLYGFPDTVSAPYDAVADASPPTDQAPETPPPPQPTEQPPPPPPLPPPVEPPEDDFITLHMDDLDIYTGNLILINHDHRYDVPDESYMVSLGVIKTASYRVAEGKVLIDPLLIEPLNSMMDAFFDETASNSVTVTSAFRSYEKQLEILTEYILQMGRTEALKWAAMPGHSEHHAGLAIDLGVFSGGRIRTFTGAGIYSWFREHAYRYGFILRYTADKYEITGVADEPWHFRYVGFPHAYIMHELDLCLEEYIELIMEHTFEQPFETEFEGQLYWVYFTPGAEVRIPFDCEFDVSGNNIDGFFVTAKFES